MIENLPGVKSYLEQLNSIVVDVMVDIKRF